MMILKFSCQLSTSCVLGSFGRRGLVPGSPHPQESENQIPGVVHLLVPYQLSLLLFSGLGGPQTMNWRSGMTKLTLQTYIVNKQLL